MQQIILEPAVGDQLADVMGQAVLCDASDRALGIFTPLGELRIYNWNHPCPLPRPRNCARFARGSRSKKSLAA